MRCCTPPLVCALPKGPARHLGVWQKLTPYCLATMFDSQLPSPKLSPKMPPKLSLAHKRGHKFLFQNYPRGEGNCETIERPKIVSRQFLPSDIKVSLLAHWAMAGIALYDPRKPERKLPGSSKLSCESGSPSKKEDLLKGPGDIWKWDFALKFALDTWMSHWNSRTRHVNS